MIRPLYAGPHATWLRRVVVMTCWLTAALAVRPASRADEATGEFLDGLRQRRLFGLAEGYCLRKLESQDLPESVRIELTIQLSRTYCDHARRTTGSEQEDLWQRAREVIASQMEKTAENRRELLEIQSLFVLAVQAESLRWQAELSLNNKDTTRHALALLSEVIPKLKAHEKQATRRLRMLPSPNRDEAEPLSPHELRSLIYRLRRRLVASLVDEAVLLPRDSADRASVLVNAEQFARQLDSGALSDVGQLDRRIVLAQISRLRGNFQHAADILQGLKTEADSNDRVMAERIRLLLAQNKVTEAAEQMNSYRQAHGGLSGELQYLFLKTLALLSEMARQKQQFALADELRQQMESRVERTPADADPYWTYRCQRLLDRLRETQTMGSKLAGQISQARALYAAGRLDAAVDAYRQAAREAIHSDRNDLAMDFGYTRASILLKKKDYEAAATAFFNLTTQFPKSPRAASAHLLGAYCLGKVWEAARSQQQPADRLAQAKAYAEALRNHREQFANDRSTADATWMLAVFEETQQQFRTALPLYRAIAIDSRKGPDAQVAVARCYEQVVQELRRKHQSVTKWQAEAINDLQQFVARFPSQENRLSLQQAGIAVRLARFLLSQAPPDFVAADQLLQRTMISARDGVENHIHDTASGQSTWQTVSRTATQLRIVSLCGRQQWEQAKTLLASLPKDEPDGILVVLNGLSQYGELADQSFRHQLGQLQLAAAERLAQQTDRLNATQQEMLLRCQAQGYLATNQSVRAIATYEELLKKTPRDSKLLRTIAELCTDQGTRALLLKARSCWRRIESLQTPGSREWMGARYQVAYCCYRLHEYRECRKLLAVTRLLYPNVEDDSLRQRFRQLEADAKKTVE